MMISCIAEIHPPGVYIAELFSIMNYWLVIESQGTYFLDFIAYLR